MQSSEEKNAKIEKWFIDGTKRLSAESGNPRYAMKASGFLRDIGELVRSERKDPAYMTAYVKYLSKYLEKIRFDEDGEEDQKNEES